MEKEETHYRNGAVVLFKRKRSKLWQARLKIGSGPKGWKRISTGEADIERASTIACEHYDEYRFRVKHNLSPDSRRFAHCATIAIKEMETAMVSGYGKRIFSDYIAAINNYLTPFFGRKNIDTIDYHSLADFNQYRIHKLGRVPARSTVNTHNAALNKVFLVALKHNWIREGAIPRLHNDGIQAPEKQVRPYFNDGELIDLLKFLQEYRNTGRKEITRQIRTLLFDYVIILANTGMRPGEEADFLKWNNISEHIDHKTGETFLKFYVSGKGKERELIADNAVIPALNRIMDRQPAFEIYDKKNPYIVNSYVFSLPCNGQLPKDLGRAFTGALSKSGLLYSTDGKKRTLYSLRHTYATKMLLQSDVKIYDLAIQMGTSVAMIEKHYGHVRASQLAPKLNLTITSKTIGMNHEQTINYLKNLRNTTKPTSP